MAKKKTETEKLSMDKYDFGVYTFEELYSLLTLTCFFMKKYKITDVVAFYKKVYPDSSFIHVENYEKLKFLIKNFYNPDYDTSKEFNNMGLEDKDILKRILELLKSMLPF